MPSITLDCRIQPKQRPRFRRVGASVITYTPAKSRHFEEMVGARWRAANGLVVLIGPVRLEIVVERALPSRRSRAVAGAPCPIRPDADNIAKSIADALNGIAYNDDAQVCELVVRKRWSASDRIIITLSPLSTFLSA